MIGITLYCGAQKLSLEDMQKRLKGEWHFKVDSSYKYYSQEIVKVDFNLLDKLVIKKFDGKRNNGYILLKLTDTLDPYFQNYESKTGFYLVEIGCTLPICHDPNVDRTLVWYGIEKISSDSLMLSCRYMRKGEYYTLTLMK